MFGNWTENYFFPRHTRRPGVQGRPRPRHAPLHQHTRTCQHPRACQPTPAHLFPFPFLGVGGIWADGNMYVCFQKLGGALPRGGTEFFPESCFLQSPSWAPAGSKVSPSQISGNLKIWDLEIWEFRIQKNQKNKKSQNQDPCCPKRWPGLD